MHGQGKYPTQVGQGPHAPEPAFQQHPPPAPLPPLPHHGPPPPQTQVIQQGHPSFRLAPGILPYQHSLPSGPHQGFPVPVVSSGKSSGQSYLSHPQPPQMHVSTQMSHSHQNHEQQHLHWNQNVHQLPPTAPHPGPIPYPLPSSQAHTLERALPPKLPSQAQHPPRPPYSSSSSFLSSDSFGSLVFSVQHPHMQSTGRLPPPPPPPTSPPPGVPPLPPHSPSSDILAKTDGGRSLKSLLHGENLDMEHPFPVKPSEDRRVHQIEVLHQRAEESEPKVEAVDAVALSPADSDMDMEG